MNDNNLYLIEIEKKLKRPTLVRMVKKHRRSTLGFRKAIFDHVKRKIGKSLFSEHRLYKNFVFRVVVLFLSQRNQTKSGS